MDENVEDFDKRVKWLHTEQYCDAGDIFGEPQKTVRVGNKYQAQIPSLMTKNERLQLVETDVPNLFEFGLSIPVTWVHNYHKNKQKKMKKLAKGKSGSLGSGLDNGLVPVPCSSVEESWSVIEQDSFILGLYIFGKNIRVVNKFMGNKGMANVLSYYYGKFYRSSQHKRWSMYRRKKVRKISVPGKKFLRGWRRQEILSRLLPHVTDECVTRLTQVISTFEAGKLSFEEYVLALRDTVGIKLLVEAIAIGKEKWDLTAKDKKQYKYTKISKVQSLKTEEIVNILNDQTGLTKANLSEVFWDGVWPRLKAKGWHYEQPTNYTSQKSKNSLVFLPPGVAKFSRRGLEKGSQYFDSLTEVLNKVASEPQLLENEVVPKAKQSSEDGQDLVKYTIADTDMAGLVKVKKLACLPDSESELVDIQVTSSVTGDTKQDTTEESQNEDMNHKAVEIHGVADSPDCESSDGNNGHDDSKTSNEKASGEDKAMEDARPKKRCRGLLIDLSIPLVDPVSDTDNSLCTAKPLISLETNTNQPEVSNISANGQRQSTRNRPLSIKALEALAYGLLEPGKKRKGSDDTMRRSGRAKTALVSSCGAPTLKT
ncbi:homeodomain-like protein [Tanacetum coccineum]